MTRRSKGKKRCKRKPRGSNCPLYDPADPVDMLSTAFSIYERIEGAFENPPFYPLMISAFFRDEKIIDIAPEDTMEIPDHLSELLSRGTSDANGAMQRWFSEAHGKHLHAISFQGVVPWSVCVTFETAGRDNDIDDVTVTVLAGLSFVSRSLKSIAAVLPRFASDVIRAASPGEPVADDDWCWLCLETLGPDGGPCTDHFGCGHKVCRECAPKVDALPLCGVCRGGEVIDRGAKREVIKGARSRRSHCRAMLELSGPQSRSLVSG